MPIWPQWPQDQRFGTGGRRKRRYAYKYTNQILKQYPPMSCVLFWGICCTNPSTEFLHVLTCSYSITRKRHTLWGTVGTHSSQHSQPPKSLSDGLVLSCVGLAFAKSKSDNLNQDPPYLGLSNYSSLEL